MSLGCWSKGTGSFYLGYNDTDDRWSSEYTLTDDWTWNSITFTCDANTTNLRVLVCPVGAAYIDSMLLGFGPRLISTQARRTDADVDAWRKHNNLFNNDESSNNIIAGDVVVVSPNSRAAVIHPQYTGQGGVMGVAVAPSRLSEWVAVANMGPAIVNVVGPVSYRELLYTEARVGYPGYAIAESQLPTASGVALGRVYPFAITMEEKATSDPGQVLAFIYPSTTSSRDLPTKAVHLAPEYAGAVEGTLPNDDSGALGKGWDGDHNYYKWNWVEADSSRSFTFDASGNLHNTTPWVLAGMLNVDDATITTSGYTFLDDANIVMSGYTFVDDANITTSGYTFLDDANVNISGYIDIINAGALVSGLLDLGNVDMSISGLFNLDEATIGLSGDLSMDDADVFLSGLFDLPDVPIAGTVDVTMDSSNIVGGITGVVVGGSVDIRSNEVYQEGLVVGQIGKIWGLQIDKVPIKILNSLTYQDADVEAAVDPDVYQYGVVPSGWDPIGFDLRSGAISGFLDIDVLSGYLTGITASGDFDAIIDVNGVGTFDGIGDISGYSLILGSGDIYGMGTLIGAGDISSSGYVTGTGYVFGTSIFAGTGDIWGASTFAGTGDIWGASIFTGTGDIWGASIFSGTGDIYGPFIADEVDVSGGVGLLGMTGQFWKEGVTSTYNSVITRIAVPHDYLAWTNSGMYLWNKSDPSASVTYRVYDVSGNMVSTQGPLANPTWTRTIVDIPSGTFTPNEFFTIYSILESNGDSSAYIGEMSLYYSNYG